MWAAHQVARRPSREETTVSWAWKACVARPRHRAGMALRQPAVRSRPARRRAEPPNRRDLPVLAADLGPATYAALDRRSRRQAARSS